MRSSSVHPRLRLGPPGCPNLSAGPPVAPLSDMSTPAQRMVAEQLLPNGVIDQRVIAVMAEIPREEFLSGRLRRHAYENRPLPTQTGQTISQPLGVALMTRAVAPKPAPNPRAGRPRAGEQPAARCRPAL